MVRVLPDELPPPPPLPLLDGEVTTPLDPPPQPARMKRTWARPSKTSLRTLASLRLAEIGDGNVLGKQRRHVREAEVLPHVAAGMHHQRGSVDLQVVMAGTGSRGPLLPDCGLELREIAPQSLLQVGHGLAAPAHREHDARGRHEFADDGAVRGGDLLHGVPGLRPRAQLSLHADPVGLYGSDGTPEGGLGGHQGLSGEERCPERKRNRQGGTECFHRSSTSYRAENAGISPVQRCGTSQVDAAAAMAGCRDASTANTFSRLS